MPDMNWNDLRVLLAISRAQTLAAAARLLRVNETTVARRLAAAEVAAGARLFQRVGGGVLRPTDAGEAAVASAERMEQAVDSFRASVTQSQSVTAGTVRLTAVPILVNHLLVPALHGLVDRYPALHLELIAELRDLSLTKREANMALRLARPAEDAGAAVLTRKVGNVRYAVYALAAIDPTLALDLPWIGYETGMSALPQARWIAARRGARGSPVALNDAAAILHSVAAGMGRSLLPCFIADHHPALRRQDLSDLPEPPSRELWLLTHPDQRELARISAVQMWLEHTLDAAGLVG
jgi:DNA-binding transcriptional LysR family regulator